MAKTYEERIAELDARLAKAQARTARLEASRLRLERSAAKAAWEARTGCKYRGEFHLPGERR